MDAPLPLAELSFLDLVATRVGDPQRLAAVAATGLLDTDAEEAFDRIARLASRLLGAPFGFITIVDERRSFWKACVGLDATDPSERQNRVEESFCQYVIGVDGVFLIDDARLDQRNSNNPSIESMGVRAWAGVPLRARTGEILGTVCVVDTEPRKWTSADAETLTELAGIAIDEIVARQTARDARESQTILEQVLSRSPIGFGLLDADLRYLMVNEALADVNGLPASDHIGRNVASLLPGIAAEVEQVLEAVLTTGEPVDGVEVVGESAANPGVERICAGSYFRIGSSDDGYRIGLLVSDITERAISRRRAERLAVIAAKLAAASSRSAIGDIVGTLVADYFGAPLAAAGSLEADGRTIQLITDSDGKSRLAEFDLDVTKRNVYGEAFRTGSMVLVPDTAARLAGFPDAAPADDRIEAVAALPLRRVDGTVIGALVIGWAHRIADSEFPRSELVTIAEVLGQTLERVQASEERMILTNAMQHSLFSSTPSLPGVDLAVRYLPATSTIGFGGDWYDVIRVDADRFALVAGDVVGHDPVAAAHMSMVRTTISVLIKQHTPMTQIYADIDALLADDRDTKYASVTICMVDTRARTLTTASAGHPPLLIADPSGAVRRLEQSLRPWVGVAARAKPIVVVPYEPGTTLLAYTDGLIETRGSNIDADIGRLVEVFSQHVDNDVETIADSLIENMLGGTGGPDDVALVVARL